MRTKAFQQFLIQITKLTPTQRKQALDHIQKIDNIEIVEDVLHTTDHCHYCGSNKFIKWGMKSGIQRYKCKDCKKHLMLLQKLQWHT